MKLANKIAVITGAGSGMGKAAALLFAAEGAARDFIFEIQSPDHEPGWKFLLMLRPASVVGSL